MNRQHRRARARAEAKHVELLRAKATDTSDVRRIVEIAYEFFKSGKAAHAIAGLRRAAAMAPDDPGLRAALGYALAATGHVGQAVVHYRAALEREPGSAALRTNLAVLLVNLGQRDDARRLLEEALDLAPEHPNTVYMHAELLARDDRERAFEGYRRAIRLLRASIGPEPRIEHCADLVKLANAEFWTGELHAALAHYDRAVALRPDYALALARRGLALAKLRRMPEAVRSLKRAAALEPDYAEARRAIGEVLIDTGDLEAAGRHLKLATRINPSDELARYFLAATTRTDVPEAPPPAYVQSLFDDYAKNFDHHLVDILQYRGPELLCEAVLEHPGRAGPSRGASSTWAAVPACAVRCCGRLPPIWSGSMFRARCWTRRAIAAPTTS